MFEIGDADLLLYAIVGVVAFVASFVGGVTGYGTGLLLPPVLLPIVGPQYVVPVISVSALLTNASRMAAFRADLDPRKAMLVTAVALPTCALGAYGYTRLSGAAVSVLIGTAIVLLTPLRRFLVHRRGHLGWRGIVVASSGYGLVTGGTSGAGIILLSILMSAGLHGPAVIATDAGISFLLGVAKVTVFQSAGALPLSAWALAALIGVSALPGPFLARHMTRKLAHSAHTFILDAVVVLGGAALIVEGLRALL